MMETDPFLKERWEEKADHEHGEESGEKGIDLYYSFLERAQKEPTLAPLVKNLEAAIGDYADSVIRLSQAKLSDDVAMVGAADSHRQRTHEVVMDAANAISRWYGKHKIDNKWRRDIVGLDRKDAGAWALAVARDVLGKNVEE